MDKIEMKLQELNKLGIIDMLQNQIKQIEHIKNYQDFIIIGEFDLNTNSIFGMKYVYCPTITGFKLGNCYNYQLCELFKTVNFIN